MPQSGSPKKQECILSSFCRLEVWRPHVSSAMIPPELLGLTLPRFLQCPGPPVVWFLAFLRSWLHPCYLHLRHPMASSFTLGLCPYFPVFRKTSPWLDLRPAWSRWPPLNPTAYVQTLFLTRLHARFLGVHVSGDPTQPRAPCSEEHPGEWVWRPESRSWLLQGLYLQAPLHHVSTEASDPPGP